MKIYKFLVAATIALSASFGASVGASAAEVKHGYQCKWGFDGSLEGIDLHISYALGEGGRPGLVWFAQITPEVVPYADEALRTGNVRTLPQEVGNRNSLFFYTGRGYKFSLNGVGSAWELHEGGLYPPTGIYRNGVPSHAAIVFSVWPIPKNYCDGLFCGNERTPGQPGSGFYVGHGLYTVESEEMVNNLRETYARTKDKRDAYGMRAPTEAEWEHRMHQLVQNDMTENIKILKAVQLPPTEEAIRAICDKSIFY